MKAPMREILHWLPRLLGIVMAVFISIFALDVFGEGYTIGELMIALFMHLVPTLILIILLVIAWRWPHIGGVLFILLGMAFIILTYNRSHWTAILLIPTPVILIGVFFITDAILQRRSTLPEI